MSRAKVYCFDIRSPLRSSFSMISRAKSHSFRLRVPFDAEFSGMFSANLHFSLVFRVPSATDVSKMSRAKPSFFEPGSFFEDVSSETALGSLGRPLEGLSAAFWDHLGPLGGFLGGWGLWGPLGVLMAVSGPICWERATCQLGFPLFGLSSGLLGALLGGPLRPSWGPLGPSWECPGTTLLAVLGRSCGPLGPFCAVRSPRQL